MLSVLTFAIVSVILVYSDLKTFHIPVDVLAAGIFLLIIEKIFYGNFFPKILPAVYIFTVYLIIYFLLKNKFGFGDVLYSFFCGLVFNMQEVFISQISACIFGIVFMLVFSKRKIPFVPFMFVGSAFTIFFRILQK